MIEMYDLEDNLITIFDSYKECAIYFNTSSACIRSHITRVMQNKLNKKLDKQNHKWYKLFKIDKE